MSTFLADHGTLSGSTASRRPYDMSEGTYCSHQAPKISPKPSNPLADQVDALIAEERLFAAGRLLSQHQSELEPRLLAILGMARDCEDAVADLIADADGSWSRQGESHSKRDTVIYYKIDEHTRLTCRIESLMEPNLLVPLLSVLNEVKLFPDWIPHWYLPHVGISKTQVLDQWGRCNKKVHILAHTPWPFKQREVYMNVVAVDDIEDREFIAVRLRSVEEDIPPKDEDVERVDFEGVFVFRACPHDHPLRLHSKRDYRNNPLLVSFKVYMDPHMTAVPVSIINFFTRTVIGQMWDMLLQVAEEVRDGFRPNHQDRIRNQAELYDWVQARIHVLLLRLQLAEEHRFVSYLQS